MNNNLLLLPLLLALAVLLASTPTDGAKRDKTKNLDKASRNISTNSTQITIKSNDGDSKKLATKVTTVKSDSNSIGAHTNLTTAIKNGAEKPSFPKKKPHAALKKAAKSAKTTPVTPPNANNNNKSKRKKVLDVAAIFKDLPADDVEFIKELDKQFQLHGDKIKIKVERVNSTAGAVVGKQTNKRTVDGELGYAGHQKSSEGYVYERPKFIFYPYSQHNIPADAPGYYPPKTEVSIQPSFSYELQTETYVAEPQAPKIIDVPRHPQGVTAHEHDGGGAGAGAGGYEEPVIVLRIPGPTKYASHLQTLLQQYLEIRAAQYLRLLEEAEAQQQQHQHHQQEQQQQQYEQPQYQQAQPHAQQQYVQHIQQEQQLLQPHAQHESHEQHVQHEQLEQRAPEHYEQQVNVQVQQYAPAQAYSEPTVELQPPQAAHVEQHVVAPQTPTVANEHNYASEIKYAHKQIVATPPQTIAYAEIEQVYQAHKARVSSQQKLLLQQEQLYQREQQEHHHQQLEQTEEQLSQQLAQPDYTHQQQQPEYEEVQQVEYAPQPQPQQEQHYHHQQQQQPQQQPGDIEQPQLQHDQQYYLPAAQQSHAAPPQYYYLPVTQLGADGSHHYQNVYFMTVAPQDAKAYAEHSAYQQPQPQQPQTVYVQETEPQHQQHAPAKAHHHHHHHEPLNENNPRHTHTRIIYTHNAEKGAADYVGGYALPSIRPFERHASKSAAGAAYHRQQQLHLQEQLLHEQQQQQHQEHEHQQQQLVYAQQPQLEQAQAQHLAHQPPQQLVYQHLLPQHQQQQQHYAYDTQIGSEHQQPSAAISPHPFNYHAYNVKASRRRNRQRKRGAATPTTNTSTPNSTTNATPTSTSTTSRPTTSPSPPTSTIANVDEHLARIREFVEENLGAKMSTAVEFKSTELLKH